jgi:two-component sensor histidine kinase
MTLLNDVNLEMSEAYFGAQQHKKAYLSLLEYSEVRDSIYTEESRTIAQEIGAKYELDKKEEAIAKQERERNILLLVLALIFFAAIGLAYAYRKIKTTNSLLTESNKEKEYLIKEIHHRVKNNLQVLSSLLNLQSDYIQDPSALSAVNEGKNRVQSMALLHQKLYTGSNLAAVEMTSYIGEFTDYLLDTFGREDEVNIESQIDVKLLDIDTAVPIGLIVNELVTNSLKYAFPAGKKGVIKVQLRLNSREELLLQVSDNGIGKNAEKQESSTSFGTDLVKILSKKLKGVIEKDFSSGYKTTLTFKKFQLS